MSCEQIALRVGCSFSPYRSLFLARVERVQGAIDMVWCHMRPHDSAYRCPMECRLVRNDGPWQCQVRLRRESDATGKEVKEVPFGPLLQDKAQLEEMLRRAQLAILNPSLPSSFFEDFDTKSLEPKERPPGSAKQLAFSNDVVCIDLKSPDVTDLSFIDLPGIIGSSPLFEAQTFDMITPFASYRHHIQRR